MALYEDEYINVEYIDVSAINNMFSGDGAEILLEIRNISEEKLRISAVNIMIKGTMVEKSELLTGELLPGKKTNNAIHIYFKACEGIKKLSDITDVTFGIKYEIGDTGVKKINGPIEIIL